MEILKATYRVATPMFMAGAEQRPELRPASFKGVLRFWFRALALSDVESWQEVKKKESELFGSTDAQSNVLMKIQSEFAIESDEKRWDLGCSYLGYGVISYNRNVRSFIKQGAKFTVTLLIKEKGIKNLEFLKKSLIALGLLGGLGARSRRGYGSVCLEMIDHNGERVWQAPINIEELKEKIQELLSGRLVEKPPEYTAFSRETRIIITGQGSEAAQPLNRLEEIGREMVRHRSYGRKDNGGRHVILRDEKPRQIYKQDHDLMYEVLAGRKINSHPVRVAFGLPHNYGKGVNVTASVHERRASPLFIHIHELKERCVAVLSLLPAKFLPEHENIKVNQQTIPVHHELLEKYTPIHDFLNCFTDRIEVMPVD